MSQSSEAGTTGEDDEERRLRAALRHLQVPEPAPRRCLLPVPPQASSEFLCAQVRRDLKLLLGAGFTEVLNAVFPVLACSKLANTILVPTKQTKKKPGADHSHHERLLGVARLLSQISEPVMKAAIEITFLLARSFFIDLCMAVFSLLARVRVLIQQMLLDVVSIYNKVTDLTDRKQAVKISISGVQAFRECYPSMDDACTVLECVWVKDKFILHEKGYRYLSGNPDMKSLEETNWPASQTDAALAEQPDKMIHSSYVGGSQSGRQLENKSGACSVPDTLSTREILKRRVAFVAVGNSKVTGAAFKNKIIRGEQEAKARHDFSFQHTIWTVQQIVGF